MECGNWVIFKERWDWIATIYIYAFFMQCTHKNSLLVALSVVFGKKRQIFVRQFNERWYDRESGREGSMRKKSLNWIGVCIIFSSCLFFSLLNGGSSNTCWRYNKLLSSQKNSYIAHLLLLIQCSQRIYYL